MEKSVVSIVAVSGGLCFEAASFTEIPSAKIETETHVSLQNEREVDKSRSRT